MSSEDHANTGYKRCREKGCIRGPLANLVDPCLVFDLLGDHQCEIAILRPVRSLPWVRHSAKKFTGSGVVDVQIARAAKSGLTDLQPAGIDISRGAIPHVSLEIGIARGEADGVVGEPPSDLRVVLSGAIPLQAADGVEFATGPAEQAVVAGPVARLR